MKVLLITVFMVLLFSIAFCTMNDVVKASPSISDPQSHLDKEKRELHIAGAYACGMLDALQEKIKRAQACDDYRAIAKSRGVRVPP